MGREEHFKTADMALVAYLDLEGFKYTGIERVDHRGVWLFDDSDELAGCVDCFQSGDAQVEPREYTQTFAGVRKRLFATLELD